MKITKKGDCGFTLLAHKKTSKTDPLIEFIGEIDHLNSFIAKLKVNTSLLKEHKQELEDIQKDLYDIMTDVSRWLEEEQFLEKRYIEFDELIDGYAELLDVKEFVTPGTNLVNAELHLCRTQSRKVEYLFWKNEKEIYNKNIGNFLNRLSSYFFILTEFHK